MTSQKPWWANRHEVHAFGEALHTTDHFTTQDDPVEAVLEYFEKPWQYNLEHEWWVWNQRTTDLLTWDTAQDTSFEVDYGQVAQ